MNKNDLITGIADRTTIPASTVAVVLSSLEDDVAAALGRGEEVRLPGFLTIEVTRRAARAGRNPRTGEAMEIAARSVPKLSAGSRLKQAAAESA